MPKEIRNNCILENYDSVVEPSTLPTFPKKILQISPYAFDHPGGVEQYAKILQEIFPEKMTTLAGGKDFPIVEPVTHFPFPAFWRRGFWQIFSPITNENTSHILSHIRFAPTSWLAFFLARRRKIPYIHVEHGTGFLIHRNFFIAGVAKMVDLTIGKYIIRHADQVVCISEAGKKWVGKTFGRKDISVIYRGFDFPQRERVQNIIPKLGFVGRLTGLKNVTGLIEALSLLGKESWTLEIVGDGEERANLEKFVGEKNLSEKIHFLGTRSHDWIMQNFYPTIDIVINPSLQEGLPTTVIEALGMGCEVIATDVGGTREIERIFLIPPDNVEALQDAIRAHLFSRKKEIFPSNQFSLEKMKVGYEKIFIKETREKCSTLATTVAS